MYNYLLGFSPLMCFMSKFLEHAGYSVSINKHLLSATYPKLIYKEKNEIKKISLPLPFSLWRKNILP